MVYLTKGYKEHIPFSPEEFKKIQEYVSTLPGFTEDTKHPKNYWGPKNEYVGLATDNSLIHVLRVSLQTIKQLANITNAKYFIFDGQKEHPISKLEEFLKDKDI